MPQGLTAFALQLNSGLLTNTGSFAYFNGASLGLNPLLFNVQTGATYTLQSGDAYRGVAMTNTGNNTVFVPALSGCAFESGMQTVVLAWGSGTTYISGQPSCLVVSRGNAFKLAGQFATATLFQFTGNAWVLQGDITT